MVFVFWYMDSNLKGLIVLIRFLILILFYMNLFVYENYVELFLMVIDWYIK